MLSDAELFKKASALVKKEGRNSISLIQRRLNIGYERAKAVSAAIASGGGSTAPAIGDVLTAKEIAELEHIDNLKRELGAHRAVKGGRMLPPGTGENYGFEVVQGREKLEAIAREEAEQAAKADRMRGRVGRAASRARGPVPVGGATVPQLTGKVAKGAGKLGKLGMLGRALPWLGPALGAATVAGIAYDQTTGKRKRAMIDRADMAMRAEQELMLGGELEREEMAAAALQEMNRGQQVMQAAGMRGSIDAQTQLAQLIAENEGALGALAISAGPDPYEVTAFMQRMLEG